MSAAAVLDKTTAPPVVARVSVPFGEQAVMLTKQEHIHVLCR